MSKKQWNKIEDTQLLMHVQHHTISEIAKIHKRPETNIKNRLKQLALDMHHNGQPMEDICNKTKMEQETLTKYIETKTHYDETEMTELLENMSATIKKIHANNSKLKKKEHGHDSYKILSASHKKLTKLEQVQSKLLKKLE